jgi:hypothetical protein
VETPGSCPRRVRQYPAAPSEGLRRACTFTGRRIGRSTWDAHRLPRPRGVPCRLPSSRRLYRCWPHFRCLCGCRTLLHARHGWRHASSIGAKVSWLQTVEQSWLHPRIIGFSTALTRACPSRRWRRPRSAIGRWCCALALRLGWMLVLSPRFDCVGYGRRGQPSPSNPATPSAPFSGGVIRVLRGFHANPISRRCAAINACHGSMLSRAGCQITRSFASRLTAGAPRPGNVRWISSSHPCRAMFAHTGEATPPCGVPAVVGDPWSWSRTPAVSQTVM